MSLFEPRTNTVEFKGTNVRVKRTIHPKSFQPMVEIYIPATKDPSKLIKVAYTLELSQDLQAISGINPRVELENMLQIEADDEYERLYGKEENDS